MAAIGRTSAWMSNSACQSSHSCPDLSAVEETPHSHPLEGVLTILALHHRLAPATINLDDFDPAIKLDVVHGEARTLPDGDIAALNNSFGFGGHNVAVVFTSV